MLSSRFSRTEGHSPWPRYIELTLAYDELLS